MLSEIRLCLLKKSDLPSGYEICDEIGIQWYGVSSSLAIPKFDKLIQVSPFEDKNGRVLKEGDEVESPSGGKYIVVYEYGRWTIDCSGDSDLSLPLLIAENGMELEYTGSVFLKGE